MNSDGTRYLSRVSAGGVCLCWNVTTLSWSRRRRSCSSQDDVTGGFDSFALFGPRRTKKKNQKKPIPRPTPNRIQWEYSLYLSSATMRRWSLRWIY